MAVDWTAGGTDANVVTDGIRTIRWGTRGLSTTAIVESCDEEYDVDKIYVENGSGVRATRFLIIQGKTYNFTVADDTAVFTGAAIPTPGQNIGVVDMWLSNGASVLVGYGTLINPRYNAARKTEGKRVLTLENMVMIDNQATGATRPF